MKGSLKKEGMETAHAWEWAVAILTEENTIASFSCFYGGRGILVFLPCFHYPVKGD